jgi:hypothetical protein
MNITELGAIGEFLSSIGVIATLIYLAVQIRQNSKTMKSGAYQKIVEDRAAVSHHMMRKHLTPVWRRGVSDYRGLSDDQKVQFNGILLTMIASHMGLRALAEDGTLDRRVFELFESDLTCVMLCPGVRDWWEDTQSAYFQWADYINELIRNGEGKQVPYTESFPFLRPQRD